MNDKSPEVLAEAARKGVVWDPGLWIADMAGAWTRLAASGERPEEMAWPREGGSWCADVLGDPVPRLCPFPSELAALQALPPASVQGELTEAGLGAAVTRPRAAPSTGTGNAWDGLLARLDGWGLSALRERCEARRALGLERYGAPVGYGGVPRSYLDEELLDGAVYAESLGDTDTARLLLGVAAERPRSPVAWTARELAVWRVLCADLRDDGRDLAALTIEALVGERVAE